MDASAQIDACIAAAPDWRGDVATHLRELVASTAPELTEDWKWNTCVWVKGKAVVAGLGIFKAHVKLNLVKGASLADPDGLFNAGFEAKGSRGIDVRDGDALDDAALRRLVRAAADAA